MNRDHSTTLLRYTHGSLSSGGDLWGTPLCIIPRLRSEEGGRGEVPCFRHGAPSVAVALGWRVENGEIPALYGNSQNKLLSVLGPLCLLHQHLAPTLPQSVFLLPTFSRRNPFYNGRHAIVVPGRALTSGPGNRVVGRKVPPPGTKIPARGAVVPPSRLPRPRHLLPFDLLI